MAGLSSLFGYGDDDEDSDYTSTGGSLFDRLGSDGYDLPSRLMMAGAFFNGEPQQALQIRAGMTKREEDREEKRKLRAIADAMIVKRPDLKQVLNAQPELALFYMKEEEQDRMMRSRQDAANEYAEEQARRKQEDDPAYQWQKRKIADIERSAGTMLERGQFPGSGIVPGAMTPEELAAREQYGVPKADQGQAQQLLAATVQGPGEAAASLRNVQEQQQQAQDAIYDPNRRKVQAIEEQNRIIQQGGLPPQVIQQMGASLGIPDLTQTEAMIIMSAQAKGDLDGGIKQVMSARMMKGSTGVMVDENGRLVQMADAAAGADPTTGIPKPTEYGDRNRKMKAYIQGVAPGVTPGGFRAMQQGASATGVLTQEGAAEMGGFWGPFVKEGGRRMMAPEAGPAYEGTKRLVSGGVLSVSGAAFSQKEISSMADEMVARASDSEEMSQYRWRRLNALVNMTHDPSAQQNYAVWERHYMATHDGKLPSEEEKRATIMRMTGEYMAGNPYMDMPLGELPPENQPGQGQPGQIQLQTQPGAKAFEMYR